MKLLSFAGAQGAELGALDGEGRVVPLSRTGDPVLASMQALIEAGEAGLASAAALVDGLAERLDPAEVHWLSPLPVLPQIRDFLGFEEHTRTAGWRGAQLRERWGAPPAPPEPLPVHPIWYRQPIYYKGNRFAIAGPNETIRWPRDSQVIDYELELACVIGAGGRDIDAADAGKHIFGFTIFNDLSARDLQFQEMQGPLGPAKGKDFDRANVLGPVIVTADEVGSEPDLAMRAFVNGELWSDGRSGTMHWSWGEIIEHVSRHETIHPGEVLGSGTVGGGCGLELGRLLRHGDEVRLEIEHIGALVTTIDAPHVTERTVL